MTLITNASITSNSSIRVPSSQTLQIQNASIERLPKKIVSVAGQTLWKGAVSINDLSNHSLVRDHGLGGIMILGSSMGVLGKDLGLVVGAVLFCGVAVLKFCQDILLEEI